MDSASQVDAEDGCGGEGSLAGVSAQSVCRCAGGGIGARGGSAVDAGAGGAERDWDCWGVAMRRAEVWAEAHTCTLKRAPRGRGDWCNWEGMVMGRSTFTRRSFAVSAGAA